MTYALTDGSLVQVATVSSLLTKGRFYDNFN